MIIASAPVPLSLSPSQCVLSPIFQACGTAGGTVTLFNRCFLDAAALRIDLPVPVHALHMGADQVTFVGEPCMEALSSLLSLILAVDADV